MQYQVWFVHDDGTNEQDALTVEADNAEEAIASVRQSFDPIRIIAAMLFEHWLFLADHNKVPKRFW